MNNSIFHFFNNLTHHFQFFDNLIVFLATTFGYLVILGTIIFLIVHRDMKLEKGSLASLIFRIREIAVFFASGLVGWLLVEFFKAAFSHPRPFIVFSEISPLFIHGGTDSFPSGHATFFASLATSIFLYHKKAGYILFACALLVGLARIIAGVHFPLDIIAGYILGIVMAILFNRIFRTSKKS